jgi:flagellar biosynthesis anti-sigma factor FlgM
VQISKIGLHTILAIKAQSPSGPEQAPGTSSAADRLSLSQRAEEIQKLREAFDQLPEVREDLVRDLGQRVKEGRYQVRDDVVAEKLLLQGAVKPE